MRVALNVRSIVGSYSSTKRVWVNCMARALFPTPTNILLPPIAVRNQPQSDKVPPLPRTTRRQSALPSAVFMPIPGTPPVTLAPLPPTVPVAVPPGPIPKGDLTRPGGGTDEAMDQRECQFKGRLERANRQPARYLRKQGLPGRKEVSEKSLDPRPQSFLGSEK